MEQNKDQSGEIPLCEQGNFYSLAKARGFTDFGMTLSGKFYDEALQKLNEQYDASLAGDVDQSGAAVRGEAVAMPQFPWNPDPINHEWTEREIAAINAYGKACYQAGEVSARAADAPSDLLDTLAELASVQRKLIEANAVIANYLVAADALDSQPTERASNDAVKIAVSALKEISEWRFGWDGDCGVTAIADAALEAIEAAHASSQPTDGGVRK